MLTKNDIMYEKKFCDDLSNKYELLISQSPKEDIYFKYDHGKWRPHVRRNGKEIYLSPQKYGYY